MVPSCSHSGYNHQPPGRAEGGAVGTASAACEVAHLRTDDLGHGQKSLLLSECGEGVRAGDLTHWCPGNQRLWSCLSRNGIIGCCQSDKEAGLVSEWTLLARQGCEHLLVSSDVEGRQSSSHVRAVCIHTHTHASLGLEEGVTAPLEFSATLPTPSARSQELIGRVGFIVYHPVAFRT